MITKKRMKKRGLSPVVATALLIAIVVVLALIIFLWARGFLSERVQKFGSAIEQACDKVDFQAGYFDDNGDDKIDIVNRGDVPLYGVVVKEAGKGSVNVKENFGATLNIGESKIVDIDELSSNTQSLLVVPILLGKAGSERVSYTCDDSFGYPINL